MQLVGGEHLLFIDWIQDVYTNYQSRKSPLNRDEVGGNFMRIYKLVFQYNTQMPWLAITVII